MVYLGRTAGFCRQDYIVNHDIFVDRQSLQALSYRFFTQTTFYCRLQYLYDCCGYKYYYYKPVIRHISISSVKAL